MTISEMKLGGGALLLSIVVLVAAFLLIASRGQLRGVSASFMGVEGIGRDAVALNTLMKATAVYGVLNLIGFGILASALTGAGERTLALVSFGLWVFASAAAVARSVFDGTITVWAGEQWAKTGSVPEFYEPLSSFAQNGFVWFAEVPWLLAAAGFGWAIVRSEIIPDWVGYGALGWSVLWLIAPLILGFDLPGVLALFPILIGIGMLLA